MSPSVDGLPRTRKGGKHISIKSNRSRLERQLGRREGPLHTSVRPFAQRLRRLLLHVATEGIFLLCVGRQIVPSRRVPAGLAMKTMMMTLSSFPTEGLTPAAIVDGSQ